MCVMVCVCVRVRARARSVHLLRSKTLLRTEFQGKGLKGKGYPAPCGLPYVDCGVSEGPWWLCPNPLAESEPHRNW